MTCTCEAPRSIFPSMHDRPGVGAAVLVVDLTPAAGGGPMILLARRENTFGGGTWCCMGGHVEHGETVAEAGARELAEECGLVVRPSQLRRTVYTEGVVEGRHYVTLYTILFTRMEDVAPRVTEPQKHPEFRWVPWHAPGVPLFGLFADLLLRYPSALDLPVLR